MLTEIFVWNWQSAIFAGITLMWWLEFVFFPSPKDGDDSNRTKEKKTFRRIMGTISVSIIVSAVTILVQWGLWPEVWRPLVRSVSLVVYGLGIVFRYGSLFSLGRHFSRNVEVDADQELISTGFYAYLRHPLYIGLWLLAAAVPLFGGSLAGFLFTITAVGAVLNERMHVEEQLMEDVLGKRYQHWKEARYRFIPFVY